MLLGMLDAGARGNGSSLLAGGLGADALAAARRIGARVRVGLLPMHGGLPIMLVARLLAQAFEAMGDTVAILDTEAPWSVAEVPEGGRPPEVPRSTEEAAWGGVPPAALERALQDASARARRVLVVFSSPNLRGPAAWLASALDGVLLIARPGGSTEFRLHKLLRHTDVRHAIGVLLVD
jgi:hypothetical protein